MKRNADIHLRHEHTVEKPSVSADFNLSRAGQIMPIKMVPSSTIGNSTKRASSMSLLRVLEPGDEGGAYLEASLREDTPFNSGAMVVLSYASKGR